MAQELLGEAKERYKDAGHKAKLFSEDVYQAASWERRRRVVYKAEVMEKGTNTRFVLSTRNDEVAGSLRVLRQGRRGRELDKGLKAACESGSPEL